MKLGLPNEQLMPEVNYYFLAAPYFMRNPLTGN
jgi:hypothetical protein